MRASYRERETFIASLLKQVPTATRADALKLLRWGATYWRLSEAQCNGDWPAENGEGKRYECPSCKAGWRVRSALKECPACRTERIIRDTCERFGRTDANGTPYFGGTDQPPASARPWVVADFQGDPRGYTVRLQIAAYERPALAVPTS